MYFDWEFIYNEAFAVFIGVLSSVATLLLLWAFTESVMIADKKHKERKADRKRVATNANKEEKK